MTTYHGVRLLSALWLRVACRVLSAFVLLVAADGNASSLNGNYFVDRRPGELLYFSLVQSGNSISGSMTRAFPGSTDSKWPLIYPVTGTMSDGALVLRARITSHGDLVINGRDQGGQIQLSFRDILNQEVLVPLQPTDEAKFNALLASWTAQSAAAARARAREERAYAELRHQANGEGSKKLAALFAMRSTEIPSDTQTITSSLEEAHRHLKEIEGGLQQMKVDAAVRPMTCDQALKKVKRDFEQRMEYPFKGSLQAATNQYSQAMRDLRERVKNAPDLVALVGVEAKAAKQPNDIQSIVAEYQRQLAAAEPQMPRWTAEFQSIWKEAFKLMREGNAIWAELEPKVAHCK